MDISSLTPDKQVKLQYWLDVIRQCRASGLTNQAWCEQHGISLKSYYYWIAKIRKLALAELPRKDYGTSLSTVPNPIAPVSVTSEFAEVSLPGKASFYTNTAAVIHIGEISVEVFEHTSNKRVLSILKAVKSC